MNILNSKILGNQTKQFIILHGLFGQSDNWGTLGKMFAEHYKVHLVDLRNHGHSFHSSEMNLPLMSEDLYDYIQHHKIEEVNLLGHSLGGKVAMEFAFAYPDLIGKLVVADITPKAYQPHHQSIIKGLRSLDLTKIRSRKEADTELSQWIPEYGVRQFLLKNLYWKEKEQLAFRFNIKAIQENYTTLIGENSENHKQLAAPTLFLSGEKSNYILNEDTVLISRYFDNYNVAEISNAGHWIHAENPKEVFQKVLSFLD